jgi:iron complex outermembrane recepter protein
VAPLNLFCGGTACNSEATLDFIRSVTQQPAWVYFDNLSVSANGSLFSLPGGLVRMAIGAEYRHDELVNHNLAMPAASPLLRSLNITGASRSVYGVYGELYVPIVGAGNAMTGIEKLELSLAGRIEDYSDFGTTKNPKVGLNWTPFDGVRLRASYGKSFRAPTLSDIDPSSTGVLRAVALTPAQVIQLGLPAATNLSLIQTQGGTAGIKPERARTYSFGADFTPRALPGFTASVNYYNIHYANRIDSPALNVGTFNALLQRSLYAPFVTVNPAFFTSALTQADYNAQVLAIEASTKPVFTGVPPAPSTVVAIVRGNRDNTGTLDTSGVDFSARYVHEGGWGTARLGVIGTYVFNYDYSILPGAPVADFVNEFSSLGSPLRFRARGEAGWDKGGFSITAFANYQNSYRYPRSLLPAAAPAQFERVRAHTTFDLTASYDTGEEVGSALLRDLRFTLAVQNLFDRDPPFVLNSGNNPILFDPTNASALGRLISVQLSKKW